MKYMKNTCAPFAALSFALALLAPAGCNEEEKVETPVFAASTSGAVFKVGEPVVFSFEGNPDFITFYSGEPGNAYEYHDRDRIEKAETTLSFVTQSKAGKRGNPNPAWAPIFYSTDFDEDYSQEGIEKATWTSLSDRFKFPTDTEQSVPSGALYIDELFPSNDAPIYVMYHYSVKQYDGTNGRTQVDITNFNISSVTASGTTPLYNLKNAGFQCFGDEAFLSDNVAQGPDVNDNRIMLRTDFKPASDMQLWAVSGPLHRPDDINSGPDGGVGIKSVADPTMRRFYHTYDRPGSYVVTFVAANSSVYGRREMQCELRITVVDDGGVIVPPGEEEWGTL